MRTFPFKAHIKNYFTALAYISRDTLHIQKTQTNKLRFGWAGTYDFTFYMKKMLFEWFSLGIKPHTIRRINHGENVFFRFDSLPPHNNAVNCVETLTFNIFTGKRGSGSNYVFSKSPSLRTWLRHLLVWTRQWNHQNELYSKLWLKIPERRHTGKTSFIEVGLVSLLLTLDIFHRYFQCFHCSVSTNE